MTRRCVCAGLLMVAAACGGGGGGGGGSADAVLSGSYQYVYLECDASGGTVFSETATFDADGAGGLVYGSGWQSDEGMGTSIRRTNGTYSLDGSRTLRVNGGFPSTLVGYVSGDGRFGTACVRTDDRDPAMMIFARRNRSPTVATLRGDWRFVEWFRRDADPSVAQSVSGRLEIDAAGSLHMNDYFYNYNGAIDPAMVVHTVVVANIGADGLIALGPLVTPGFQGGVSERGDVILLGGREMGGRRAAVRILCRVGEAVGASSVSGPWRHLAWEANRPGYETTWGTPSFDGVDRGEGDYRSHHGEAVSDAWPLSFTYGVGVTSQAALLLSGANRWAGAAGDGLVVLAGGYVPGSPPALHVIVR